MPSITNDRQSLDTVLFNRVSKGLLGKQAEIEVTGLPFGDRVAAKWLPLLGITYHPKDDLVEIALEGSDHLIHQPREISVEDGPEGLTAMEIVGADQRRQIVRLREPLMLMRH
jgi:Family of unknown function (DUF5335)